MADDVVGRRRALRRRYDPAPQTVTVAAIFTDASRTGRAMNTQLTRRVLSYLLIAGGALLLIWGVRDIWESRAGQSNAAREFQEENAQQAPPVTPATRLPAPHRGEPLAELVIPR